MKGKDQTDRVWKNAKGVEIKMIKGLGIRIPRIIAISGKYGTGKDSLIEMIERLLIDIYSRVQIEKLKFAGALKAATAAITATTVEENYTDEGKAQFIPEIGMTLGRIQQVLGTIARQHIHPDIWVTPVIRRCMSDDQTFYLISDCRFINEVEKIQAIGGLVIRLNRKAELISEKSTAGRDPTHISETCLDDYQHFDFIYDNNGTLDELQEAVFNFLKISGY